MERNVTVNLKVNGKLESSRTVAMKTRTTWADMGRSNPGTMIMKPKKGKGSYDRKKCRKEIQKEMAW